MEAEKVEWRRVGLYLLIAFGFTWAIDAVIWANGGLTDGPALIPGVSLALALIALSMFGPALAHLLTRLLTREGWQHLWLRPHFRRGWQLWALVWVLTPVLVFVGAALYFALFPHHFDPSLSALAALGGDALDEIPIPLEALFALQIVQGIVLAPLLNAIPILGEEFGWRAYLQPKLLPLGERRMYLITGVIWGLWHAPIILMGYNYGVDYPGTPWAGALMMIWFTIVVGTFLGWATLRAGSVWPAVIGHGSLNGIAPAVLLVIQGAPNPLLGPAVTGVIGSVGFTVVALLIWWRASGVPTTEEAYLEAAPLPAAELEAA